MHRHVSGRKGSHPEEKGTRGTYSKKCNQDSSLVERRYGTPEAGTLSAGGQEEALS